MKTAVKDQYVFWYQDPQGVRSKIGECAFVTGCNHGYYWIAEEPTAPMTIPRCIISTGWINGDGGRNDAALSGLVAGAYTTEETENERYLDVLTWEMSPASRKILWKDEKYAFPNALASFCRETAMFSVGGGL